MKPVFQSEPNIWFPGLRRRPDAAFQLFCFAYAGGGASAYFRWRDLMPAEIELWPIEYPAHESRLRESPAESLVALAGQIAEQVARAIDRPFALFGHSMGSLIAFEVARLLERDYGLAPITLFVSSYSAAQLPRDRPPVRHLPEPEFHEVLRFYGGTPEEILADARFMAFLSPLLRQDFGLCETYEPATGGGVACPIVAFGGYADLTVSWDRLLAWGEQTEAGFRAHMMPGGHFYLAQAGPAVIGIVHRQLATGGDVPLTAPQRDEVHLWAAEVEQPAGAIAALGDSLSPAERARAAAFAREADRARAIVARGALRDLLHRYIGLPARAFAIEITSTGKPTCEAARPIAFNLSHSGAKALIGFTSGQSLGVDIEQVRADVYTAQLAERFATPREIERLAAIDPGGRAAAFFDLWVRKEAGLKRTGEGFAGLSGSVEVGLSPYVAPPGEAHADVDERIQSFTVAPGYAAAVAAERPIRLLTIRAWRPPAAA